MRKEPLLDGVPELLVLCLLRQTEMHGYRLVAEIRSRTAGKLQFSEGCVYLLLHRLRAQALLSERRKQVAGRERRCYRLNAAGRKRLARLETTWQHAVLAVHGCGKARLT